MKKNACYRQANKSCICSVYFQQENIVLKFFFRFPMGRIQPSQKLFEITAVIGVNQVYEFMDHDKTEQAWRKVNQCAVDGYPSGSVVAASPATFHFPDGEEGFLFDYFRKSVSRPLELFFYVGMVVPSERFQSIRGIAPIIDDPLPDFVRRL